MPERDPPTPPEDEPNEPTSDPAPGSDDEEIRDPFERETIHFFTEDAPLLVRISDGPVGPGYAPAELVARIAERIAGLLKDLGGGFVPMLYGIGPGSITLAFGDPDPMAAQGQLPVEATATQAARVADLIDLEGDDLFTQALRIGAPVRQYNELTQLVQSEGITLTWAVRASRPRVLTPQRAQRQHTRLSAPVETRDRPLTVNGVLYRVITESTREGFLGSVGIHLHSWSGRPPGERSKERLIAFYERPEVEARIKAGLVGESVEARLSVRQAVPGTSIEPERFDLVLDWLDPGPPEDVLLGPGLEFPEE